MEKRIEITLLNFLNRIKLSLSRFALFLVYFWFGILKLIGTSPANPLVMSLMEKTLPFLTWNSFIFVFSIFEMIIGIMFLIPKLEKIAFTLLIVHIFMTILPLFLLPEISWQGFLTPTLEGQYMIKNIVLVALALNIVCTTNKNKIIND